MTPESPNTVLLKKLLLLATYYNTEAAHTLILKHKESNHNSGIYL